MAAAFKLVVDNAGELEPWLDTDLGSVDAMDLEFRMRWFRSPELVASFLRASGPLRTLTISTDATLPLPVVEALAEQNQLEELSIMGDKPVRDPQMMIIAASFPKLRKLLIDDGVFSIAAYRALADAPFRKTLRTLFVAFCSFSGALDVLASTSWPALEKLSISGNEQPEWKLVERFDVEPLPLVLAQSAFRGGALQMARNVPSRRSFTQLIEYVQMLDDSVYEEIAPELTHSLSEWPDEERAVLHSTQSWLAPVELDPRPYWSLVRELRCDVHTRDEAHRLVEGPPLDAVSLELRAGYFELDLRERFPRLESLAVGQTELRFWDALKKMQLPPIKSLELDWRGDVFYKPTSVHAFREWLPKSIRRVRIRSVTGFEIDGCLGRADADGWRHEVGARRPDYPIGPVQ